MIKTGIYNLQGAKKMTLFSKELKNISITLSNQGAGTMVHGEIYKKTKEDFQQLKQSGEGLPVSPLILKFNQMVKCV